MCQSIRQCAFNSTDVLAYLIFVSGDAASLSTSLTHYFIATCEEINVLKPCVQFLFMPKRQLSLFLRIIVDKKNITSLVFNYDILLS